MVTVESNRNLNCIHVCMSGYELVQTRFACKEYTHLWNSMELFTGVSSLLEFARRLHLHTLYLTTSSCSSEQVCRR